MKKVQAQGFNKAAALATTGLDVELDQLKNATQAWKKAGSPLSDKQIGAFANEYLKKHKAIGAFIVIDPSTDDTRIRPYTVINEVTKGKRKATTKYQIKEAEFDVKYKKQTVTNEEGVAEEVEVPEVKIKSVGAVVATADKKDDAAKLLKEFISKDKTNYVVEIVKEITEGQKYALYGQYTPSTSAKQGTFLFFTAE